MNIHCLFLPISIITILTTTLDFEPVFRIVFEGDGTHRDSVIASFLIPLVCVVHIENHAIHMTFVGEAKV